MSDNATPKDSLYDADATRVTDPGATRTTGGQPPHTTFPSAQGANANAPRQVGRYQVMERIGRGGMASVFRAHDPGIDRVIAIKFLHTAYCQDDEYRGRFLREARAAGNLSHPNIVTVHDVGEIDGRPYMAMELIQGEPLDEMLKRTGALPIRDTLAIGQQLANALAYAHSKGVVHRDIKPSNILGVKGTMTVKVTDFGIAHVSSPGSAQQTQVGAVLGTPQYMSPEQTKGAKVDGRSDLFSVGIILYQMLSGTAPFQGDSVVALAMKIANEEPRPLDTLRPEIPQAVRRIVERCLAKAPERRFQSGKELADALSRALFNLDEEARQQGRSRIVPLRVKWAVTMGLIVFAVMAITGGVVNRLQGAAMIQQVTDYGAALSRFIAAQNAVAVLSEEWVAVEVALQEIMKTRDFKSVTVVDHGGIVRASSDAAQIGQPYQPRSGARLDGDESGVNVTRYAEQGDSILGFEAPMTFQGKTIGRVALGIPEAPLTRVARLSLSLMAGLVVITVLAVAVAMYFLANWFARPIKLLSESMTEISQGRFEHRIREQRRDEFGALFRAFDAMAQSLQERFIPGPPAPVAGPAVLPAAVEPKRPKAAPVQAAASAANADAADAKRPAPGAVGPQVAKVHD